MGIDESSVFRADRKPSIIYLSILMNIGWKEGSPNATLLLQAMVFFT